MRIANAQGDGAAPMTAGGRQCEPAASLIERLGGYREVARCIAWLSVSGQISIGCKHMNPGTVYRWTVARNEWGGTSGTIPVKYWPAMVKIARQKGIELTIADLCPDVAEALGPNGGAA